MGADDPGVSPLIDVRGGLAEAVELAADLTTMAPLTLGYIKATCNELARGSHNSPVAAEAFDRVWASDDFREGMASRSQGRAAAVKGV